MTDKLAEAARIAEEILKLDAHSGAGWMVDEDGERVLDELAPQLSKLVLELQKTTKD